MDDLGVPPFQETPVWSWVIMSDEREVPDIVSEWSWFNHQPYLLRFTVSRWCLCFFVAPSYPGIGWRDNLQQKPLLVKKRNMVPVKIFPYTILEYLRIAHQAIDRKQNIILNISISLDWLDELLETTYIRFSQYKWFSPNPMKYWYLMVSDQDFPPIGWASCRCRLQDTAKGWPSLMFWVTSPP